MKKILIIDTGGTFNKVYNPITGVLDINSEGNALETIAKRWLVKFKSLNIIGKDSLDMTDVDRELIVETIRGSEYKSIIIIHGTDTIDKTAKSLSDAKLDKKIVLTGAMVPFSIDSIEATANFASSYGYINNISQDGIFIVMNGVMDSYENVIKNKTKGYFESTP